MIRRAGMPLGRAWRTAALLPALAMAVGIAGCSGSRAYPPLADVTGRVTLGGRPVGEIRVCFRHRDGGRTAVGLTDSDGRFAMRYHDTAVGATIGPNVVSFLPLPGVERFPKELLEKRDVEVVAGTNTFDFQFEVARQKSATGR